MKQKKGYKKDQKGEDEENQIEEGIIYPRITDADKRNDRKSLYRALEKEIISYCKNQERNMHGDFLREVGKLRMEIISELLLKENSKKNVVNS